ncbi:DinB family protein [Kitasatospora sp. NPDC096147]|uniref:DinB family protein n=1 Tax=Kitasatospora sp. NPDC096147 TaxID=3364093 RepID=UPI0037F3EC34
MTGTTDLQAETTAPALTGERADLLEQLGKSRFFLRFTANELTDGQAGHRSTVSGLTVGGLIKHVASVEKVWVDFILGGPSAMPDFSAMTEEDFAARENEFRLLEDETLEGVLAAYAEVAARTDALVATVDLDAAHPLPKAPWFDQDAKWSARRVFLHVIAETSQHAGHADIVREAIDGAKSMG